MKKITALTEIRLQTVYYKDEYGNRERDTEEYVFSRPVKSIAAGPRLVHFIIDMIVFQVILYFAGYFFKWIEKETGDSSIVAFIDNTFVLLLYPALYTLSEYLWQRTPGKFITKTIVIDEYGNKPDLRTIILRSLIRLVPFEPFSCTDEKYSYGWHDKWSGTWVVTEEELKTIKQLQAEQTD